MESKDFPQSFYRVTIKGLCVRDGQVLLSKESDQLSGIYEIPGGGLDFGEDIEIGFKREIEEEMGLKVTKMSKVPVYVWTYKYENMRDMAWFYTLVLAYRIEFENLDFKPTTECTEIQFFSKEQLSEIPLNGLTNNLAEIFNPDDFKDDF